MDDGDEQVDELTLEPTGPGRTSRRRALWGVLAAVAVAAGALVVISAGDDGTPSPGLPVALGSSLSSREASGAAADAMLAWVTYVPGADLPALGGDAPAYRLPSRVTEEQVRSLAEALGLDGEIVHEGPGWTVTDGTAYLEVYEGGAQWWYSSSGGGVVSGSGSSSGGSAGVACAEGPDGARADCAVRPTTTTSVCGPGTSCSEPSPPPDCAVLSDGSSTCIGVESPPPVELPPEDEARAVALDRLAGTGMDVEDAIVTVEGPYDAWSVSVEPLLAGIPSGLVASVSVGSGGAVTTAAGYLADPQRLGDYPLLDTRAAIDRANAEPGGTDGIPAETGEGTIATSGTAGTTVVGGDDPAITTGPDCAVQADGSEICRSTGEGTACPGGTAPADVPLGAPETIECTPPVSDPGVVPEPVPDPGPVEVVLVDAERSLVLLGAIDGSTDVYLVPAYRFTDENGGRVDLPAVADSALTTPSTTETSADEPPVTPTDEPQPCGEVLVEEDASGTTHTLQPYPCPEPLRLPEGEEPQIGVGYYVDVNVGRCSYVDFDGSWWLPLGVDPLTDGWSTPTEGGTLTLTTQDEAAFLGDASGTKIATFERGPSTDAPSCGSRRS